ncbi:hypothetical protein GE09DRAFT_1151245 [Coniochaeta sp. 2T2.1]|nr:hypothetical protein GE09DRAFT_1151245 [Coniochaeta sp. 2T2.1]
MLVVVVVVVVLVVGGRERLMVCRRCWRLVGEVLLFVYSARWARKSAAALAGWRGEFMRGEIVNAPLLCLREDEQQATACVGVQMVGGGKPGVEQSSNSRFGRPPGRIREWSTDFLAGLSRAVP